MPVDSCALPVFNGTQPWGMVFELLAYRPFFELWDLPGLAQYGSLYSQRGAVYRYVSSWIYGWGFPRPTPVGSETLGCGTLGFATKGVGAG